MSTSRTLANLNELKAFSDSLAVLKNRSPKHTKTINELIESTELHINDVTEMLSSEDRVAAARYLANIIENNPYVSKLDLSRNHFSAAETIMIARAFERVSSDPTLCYLDLSNGSFGGAEALVVLIKAARSKTLQAINLANSLSMAELVDKPHSFVSPVSSNRSSISESKSDSTENNYSYATTDEESDAEAYSKGAEIKLLSPLVAADASLNASQAAYKLMELRLGHEQELIFDEQTKKFLARLEKVFGDTERREVIKKLRENRNKAEKAQELAASGLFGKTDLSKMSSTQPRPSAKDLSLRVKEALALAHK